MDDKTLARIGAVILVALAIAEAVIDRNRTDDNPAEFAAPEPAVIAPTPLDTELARCAALGEVGPRDSSCLKAWAENRRRFLGQPPAFTPPALRAVRATGAASPSPQSGAPAAVDSPAAHGGR